MDPFLHTKDYFYSNEDFTLLYDTKLDMLVTEPVPKHLENYYHSEHYISHSDSAVSFIDKIYLLVKRFSLQRKIKLINSLHPEKGALLDIGAGTGDFLINSKNSNWSVTGIEPNSHARKKAETKGISLYTTTTQIPNKEYDVITLWHVLEHLPDLDKQIETISSLLKDKGTLIIAVPNYKSYDAKYYRHHWAAYDVPRHLWHFSRKSITALFKPYHLDLMKTKPMLFDSFYVALLSEKYKNGKTNYVKAFYHGLLSNLKGLHTKEYSSHIYILKKT